MSFQEVIDKMKRIQVLLLEYFEDESDNKEIYENFQKIIIDQKIIEDRYLFKSLLHLINNIGNNHQRVGNFIIKIERILGYFKDNIKIFFSNSEIFKLFESNKRILLFLIEEKIIVIDEYFVSQLSGNKYTSMKYPEYFAPEIKPFVTKEFVKKCCKNNPSLKEDEFYKDITKEVTDDFYEKRKIGENDDYLCQIIRLNKIDEFIVFANKTNLHLDACIKQSIFETNYFLVFGYDVKLIEYASFFGSIGIIKYIQMKEYELTPNMWSFSIHSRNAELIKYLEDNHVSPPSGNYESILMEAIECHHNEISTYFIENVINEEDLLLSTENKFSDNYYFYSVEYQNYCFFPENPEYKNMLFYLCMFDYYTLVKLYLQQKNVDFDINAKSIMIYYFK
ncbi:hypothetical protein M9Y10_015891 [Tritrichomonas musculus]|uniref:DUF3447 domain-containing protein n=1 Tax=Tritrichomonas musculus TaxID=1915356 RepID=A0ABR2I527_9EUKA